MKTRSSVIRMAVAALTATTLCLGAAATNASAQNTSATKTSTAQAPALPYNVGEVVKLYQAGINKDVIAHYISSSASPYHLSADEIISLQTLGVPQEITQAMLQRDSQLQQGEQAMQSYGQQQMPATTTAQPPAQVVLPTTPAPDVTVIGSGYPAYDYGYPYYGDDYWPPVVIGGGWGWGWGHGWGWGRGGFGGFHGGFGGGFHGGFSGGHGGGFGGGHGGGHR